ncbi:MAG: hypothetical protein PHU85_02275 [Phycisphaerae bacterium]|nr:hypothetical protein [Phycisphaerae bacterium]
MKGKYSTTNPAEFTFDSHLKVVALTFTSTSWLTPKAGSLCGRATITMTNINKGTVVLVGPARLPIQMRLDRPRQWPSDRTYTWDKTSDTFLWYADEDTVVEASRTCLVGDLSDSWTISATENRDTYGVTTWTISYGDWHPALIYPGYSWVNLSYVLEAGEYPDGWQLPAALGGRSPWSAPDIGNGFGVNSYTDAQDLLPPGTSWYSYVDSYGNVTWVQYDPVTGQRTSEQLQTIFYAADLDLLPDEITFTNCPTGRTLQNVLRHKIARKQVGHPDQNQVQRILISDAVSGSFTLTFNGYTTAVLNYSSTAADVTAALGALTSIGGEGNIIVGEAKVLRYGYSYAYFGPNVPGYYYADADASTPVSFDTAMYTEPGHWVVEFTGTGLAMTTNPLITATWTSAAASYTVYTNQRTPGEWPRERIARIGISFDAESGYSTVGAGDPVGTIQFYNSGGIEITRGMSAAEINAKIMDLVTSGHAGGYARLVFASDPESSFHKMVFRVFERGVYDNSLRFNWFSNGGDLPWSGYFMDDAQTGCIGFNEFYSQYLGVSNWTEDGNDMPSSGTYTLTFTSPSNVTYGDLQQITGLGRPFAEWTLGSGWAETTAPIAWNATAAQVQAALEDLPSIGLGNITVVGDFAATPAELMSGAKLPHQVTFTGALGKRPLDFIMLGKSYAPDPKKTPRILISELQKGAPGQNTIDTFCMIGYNPTSEDTAYIFQPGENPNYPDGLLATVNFGLSFVWRGFDYTNSLVATIFYDGSEQMTIYGTPSTTTTTDPVNSSSFPPPDNTADGLAAIQNAVESVYGNGNVLVRNVSSTDGIKYLGEVAYEIEYVGEHGAEYIPRCNSQGQITGDATPASRLTCTNDALFRTGRPHRQWITIPFAATDATDTGENSLFRIRFEIDVATAALMGNDTPWGHLYIMDSSPVPIKATTRAAISAASSLNTAFGLFGDYTKGDTVNYPQQLNYEGERIVSPVGSIRYTGVPTSGLRFTDVEVERTTDPTDATNSYVTAITVDVEFINHWARKIVTPLSAQIAFSGYGSAEGSGAVQTEIYLDADSGDSDSSGTLTVEYTDDDNNRVSHDYTLNYADSSGAVLATLEAGPMSECVSVTGGPVGVNQLTISLIGESEKFNLATFTWSPDGALELILTTDAQDYGAECTVEVIRIGHPSGYAPMEEGTFTLSYNSRESTEVPLLGAYLLEHVGTGEYTDPAFDWAGAVGEAFRATGGSPANSRIMFKAAENWPYVYEIETAATSYGLGLRCYIEWIRTQAFVTHSTTTGTVYVVSSAADPTLTVVQAGHPRENCIQELTFAAHTAVTSGTFAITFQGSTANIAWNATEAEVQTAMDSIWGVGNIIVTADPDEDGNVDFPGAGMILEFDSDYAYTAYAAVEIDSTLLHTVAAGAPETTTELIYVYDDPTVITTRITGRGTFTEWRLTCPSTVTKGNFELDLGGETITFPALVTEREMNAAIKDVFPDDGFSTIRVDFYTTAGLTLASEDTPLPGNVIHLITTGDYYETVWLDNTPEVRTRFWHAPIVTTTTTASPQCAVVGTIQDGSAGTALTLTAVTENSGPNDWSEPLNWSSQMVPVDGDDVVLQSSAVSILYNYPLAADALALKSFRQYQSFTGKLGSEQLNAPALCFTAITADFGLGDGVGSLWQRVEFGTGIASQVITVHATRTGTIVRTLNLSGGDANTHLYLKKGYVGVNLLPGDTGTLGDLWVLHSGTPATDVNVQIGTGTTLTTINQTGGVVEAHCSVTTWTQTAGTAKLKVGAVTTLTCTGGIFYYDTGTNTIASLTVGTDGVVDGSQGGGTVHVTTPAFPGSITLAAARTAGYLVDPLIRFVTP